MQTFKPWIGQHYTEGVEGKRLLILGESHHGGEGCHYSDFTIETIRKEALGENGHRRRAFFTRVLHLIVGGRGGVPADERIKFWNNVAFYNFIQTALETARQRPTYEMWQAAHAPLLHTIEDLKPEMILVLGKALQENLPSLPHHIITCGINHPSAKGFTYDEWQPKVYQSFFGNN